MAEMWKCHKRHTHATHTPHTPQLPIASAAVGRVLKDHVRSTEHSIARRLLRRAPNELRSRG